MIKGKVKFFNEKKNFGFIENLETSQTYYVHGKDLLEKISEGDLVEFEVEILKRGPSAKKVRTIKQAQG